MNIQFLGHACFLITSGNYSLIIDPFLSGSATAAAKPDDIDATHVFVTHGHGDHIGDAISIARRCHSLVYATVETAALFGEDVAKDVGQPGGFLPAEFGGVKFTTAAHGSSVPGGLACGFLITIDEKKIYHAGDTGLIMDMALLETESVDLALLPIGDRYTMGPKDAVRAIELIKPKRVIPMHYNTFPVIVQDPKLFKQDAEAKTGIPVTIMQPGESIRL